MYTSFYAFSAKPFTLTPDPEFLYLSRIHKEALAHLSYGVESRSGFVMVTGEVGAGKTTLLRTLIRNLGSSIVLSQVNNTRVTYKELLELILEDFGVEPRGLNKTGLLSTLNEFLIERYRDGLNCVVIVDEAQNLGIQTLEGLRMLSNLETEKAKLIHIILAGQPGLRDLIDSPQLEQLRQRITVRYHLGSLGPGEVGEYIQHRLQKVVTDEGKAPVFPDESIPLIHKATGGIPRLVNILCDAALLHGYVGETRVMNPDIVAEVAEQMDRNLRGSAPKEEVAEAQAVSESEQRIQLLESRLEEVVKELRARPVAASGGPAAREGLTRKEKEISRKEVLLEERIAELSQREKEFNGRLNRIKAEWKRRMRQMEEVRREVMGGNVRFPPLKVYVFEQDPRLQDALGELLDGAGVPYEVFSSFREMMAALEESGSGGWFAVAVVGAGADDTENESCVATLSSQLPHVPTVFLSDIDLSTIRRRMFAAGANYFIEKPNGRAASFASHRESLEHLKSDLLRAVQGIHRQHKALFDTFNMIATKPENAPQGEV